MSAFDNEKKVNKTDNRSTREEGMSEKDHGKTDFVESQRGKKSVSEKFKN